MEKKPQQIGEVIHVFSKIGVAVVKFSKPISVGDKIRIKGHSDDFSQTIESMQVDHEQVQKVKKGQEAGMKVSGKVHEGDKVYLED
jgi:putative protease